MPTAIVGALVAAGASAAVATFVANAIVNYAISYIVNALFGADTPDAPADPGVQARIPTDPKNKLPVVYGEREVAGQAIFADISADNQTMAFIIAVSEGPVEAIDTVRWEDKTLQFSSALSSTAQGLNSIAGKLDRNGDATTGGAHDFDGIAYDFLDGNVEVAVFPAGGRCTPMEAFSTRWNTNAVNRTMPNTAYAFLKLTYDRDDRVTGLPSRVYFNVKGRTVDTLDDANGTLTTSSTMSTNPTDCLIDYMLNTRYGCGLPTTSLDYATFFSHKTFCNVSINHNASDCSDTSYTNKISCEAAGETWNQHTNVIGAARYTVNGVVNTNQELDRNIADLTTGNGGSLTYNLGKFGLISEGVTAVAQRSGSDVVFSEDNIIGKIEIIGSGFDKILNEVTVRFDSDTQINQEEQVKVEIPVGSPIRNDNEPRLEKTLKLPFTVSNVEAERMATVLLNDSREHLIVKFSSDLKNTDIQAGDVIEVSHETPGWVDKEFRVQQVNEKFINEGEFTSIGVEIIAKEYADAVYTAATINLTDPSPNTFFPNPFNAPVPIITVADASITVNGVPEVRLQVDWTTTQLISYGEVWELRFIKRTGAAISTFPDSAWTHLSTVREELIIGNLEPETRYHIQLRSRNTLGVLGDYTTFFEDAPTNTINSALTVDLESILPIDIIITSDTDGTVFKNNAGSKKLTTTVTRDDGITLDHSPYNFLWKKAGATICVNSAGDVIETATVAVTVNQEACESAGGFWTGTLCNAASDTGADLGGLFDTQSGSILGCATASLSRADTDNSRINGTVFIGTPLDVTTTDGSFVIGVTYRILTLGTTDFVAIGATSDTIGIIFVATGVGGAGAGTARSERFRNITLGAEDITDAEEITCTVSNIDNT